MSFAVLPRVTTWSAATTLLFLAAGASPSPLPKALQASGHACATIRVHKEWRDLTIRDRHTYIKAAKCLQALPPRTLGLTPTTRCEEFIFTHARIAERTHGVGQFLPWHRIFVNLYAKALRKECGYKGSIPFWDWARDGNRESIPLSKSPVFDPVTGFEGDGVPGTYTLPPDFDPTIVDPPYQYRGCVQDGPFADLVLKIGPGRMVTEHCLVRSFNETWRRRVQSDLIERQLSTGSFEEFGRVIEGEARWGLHWLTHIIVGGEMSNIWSSPADPIFYLSHLNLDRMWWHWQKRDPEARLNEIWGPTTQGGNDTVTLDFVPDFPALGPNVTIRDVMDTTREPSCFTFAY